MSFKYSIACLVLFASYALAQESNSLDLENPQDEDNGRILFNNNGNLMLQTNATAIIGIIVLLVVLGLIIAGAFFLFDGTGRNTYEYENVPYAPYDANSYAGYEQDPYYRNKRSTHYDNELATQLYLLENAFKYWDVDNDACKTFVVCEASKKELEQNEAEVVKKTRAILGDLSKHKAALYKEPFRRLLSIFLKEEKDLEAKCSKAKQACFASKKSY